MVAPTALMTRLRCILLRAFGSRSSRRWRFQCRIIPVWLSVKDTKTPTMYSWMSFVTSAS